VLVAAPNGRDDLYRAFDNTKHVSGPFVVQAVNKPNKTLRRLFRDGQRAKCKKLFVDQSAPKRSLRGEYYAWLAGLEPGERIIRYGCDRYFNGLNKRPLVVRPQARTKHPYPFWLKPWQFGSHAPNCECRVCRASS
jgi:hypothetical protein